MARRTTTSISTGASRRVFVDTSAWYAVAVEDDKYHEPATRHFGNLLSHRTPLLTSDYVLDETLTRIRYDLGHAAAVAFWERLVAAQHRGQLQILTVGDATWAAALELFRTYDDQWFSFTDCTSFVLAREHNTHEAFAFDDHFRIFGLVVRPAA